MPKIIDNIEIFLTHELKETVEISTRVDFCVGYFNLRGWKQVSDYIDKLPGAKVFEGDDEMHRHCRLLVGMQRSPNEIIKDYFYHVDGEMIDNKAINRLKKQLAQDFKDQLTIGTPSDEDEIYLRKLSAQIKEKKVVVKLYLKHNLHAKLYLAYSEHRHTPVVGFLGSSNLTFAGLQYQGELNVDVIEQDAAKKLEEWFNDRWNDSKCVDISEELAEVIDTSWAGDRLVPPYHIYLKIAYHLSQEARAGLNEFKISKQFQNELLLFQQFAVRIAAHHLNKRGGVLIGDVVGLGKTIIATAVAKIFQEDFYYKTLIICPPNLIEMWEDYRYRYDLNAEIISLGEVINRLPKERRYRLVIIDESHNLRNSEGKRYRAVKEYLAENESKVIMLSATPYNKSFLDLANQLSLFIPEDQDLGISPERYITFLGGAPQFSEKHTETFIRSIKAFEKSHFADDWRELMRFYMVRRTRSFIKQHYAHTDTTNGRKYLLFSDGTPSYFPERIPKRVEFEFNPDDRTDQYAKLYSQNVVDIINKLGLPRYGIGNYIEKQPSRQPSADEQIILDNLSRAGKRLMGFCRTNLFKRLESSGYSFLLSVSRHILRNFIFIYAIQNRLPLPIGKQISGLLDDFVEDEDIDANDGENELRLILDENKYLDKAKDVYNLFESPYFNKQFDWIDSGFFTSGLMRQLLADAKLLVEVLKIGKDWNAADDRKLKTLYEHVIEKHPNEKLLVFTQYADTAVYLFNELSKLKVKQLDCVTGDDEHPTEKAYKFSPLSNKRLEKYPAKNQTRVLISTDVLSEGQNLQDAHIIYNFDLPWAIIRLIQRAGRVDRIGQKAEEILCYSFLPEDGIEQIINLRGRLSRRIRENAEVVGADETFFDGDPININDLYSEKSGILDDEESDQDVDLASYAFQIWKNATDANPQLKKTIPDLPSVIYSTKLADKEEQKPGVVVYTKTADDNDVLTWVSPEKEIITQSQLTILKAAECTADTPALYKIPNHHDLVKKGVEYIQQEEKNMVGTLGKKSGVKYRIWHRLNQYFEYEKNTLFANEVLKKALDTIYKFPMREFARESIGRQMKAGASDEDLALLLVSLYEEDKLCIIEEDKLENKQPQIICSLGLAQQQSVE